MLDKNQKKRQAPLVDEYTQRTEYVLHEILGVFGGYQSPEYPNGTKPDEILKNEQKKLRELVVMSQSVVPDSIKTMLKIDTEIDSYFWWRDEGYDDAVKKTILRICDMCLEFSSNENMLKIVGMVKEKQ